MLEIIPNLGFNAQRKSPGLTGDCNFVIQWFFYENGFFLNIECFEDSDNISDSFAMLPKTFFPIFKIAESIKMTFGFIHELMRAFLLTGNIDYNFILLEIYYLGN